MKIKVTQNDIEYGTVDCVNCPIARALKRATKKKFRVFYTQAIGKDRTLIFTPEIEGFIRKFDNGQKVEPFTFEITL